MLNKQLVRCAKVGVHCCAGSGRNTGVDCGPDSWAWPATAMQLSCGTRVAA